MAEYLSASSPRRKTIVQEARFPKTSVTARYNIARDSLTEFLADHTRSAAHIANAIDRLDKRGARSDATEWVKQDCRSSKEAVEAFQRAYNRFGLTSIQCEKVHGRLPFLVIGPTKISVSVDLWTKKKNMEGPDAVGGAVFIFSRGEAQSKKRVERCKIVGGLIYDYLLSHPRVGGVADTSTCLGIDVFGQKSYPPPGTFARARRQIEDSCEEIALRWYATDPPSGYDGPDPG